MSSVPPTPPIRRRASAGSGSGAGPQQPGWRVATSAFLRRRGGWLLLGLVALLVAFGGYVVWTLRDLPDPGKEDVLAHSITIFDRHNQVIELRDAKGQFHQPLKVSEMGRYGPAATVAAEDRNFYHEGAVNYLSTLRAAYEDLIHHSYLQGGSTITQQLIKIQLLTPQKSIFRKLQEVVLAEAVSHRYSKDQVIEMYLNRVYYGHNAYGLGAAAQTYFGAGKTAKDLDIAQAAFLAGLINAPVYYDPQTHFDRARARQLYVLKGMVATGAITQAEADQAAAENIQSQLKFDTGFRQSKAPHFVDYVLAQLEKQEGAAAIQQGGFAIHTTLDLQLQTLANQAVKDGVSALSGEGIDNGMLLAARPDTGEILAWVGSADYYNTQIGGQFDVVLAPRQPGSSFKPYVYEAALKDHKITLASTLQDKPTDFGGGYKPLDFDNRFEGAMSARTALVESRNVPAVQVGQMESMTRVADLAHAMGIHSQIKNVPSAAIGSSEVTMYEHLQGYQTFAGQGKLVPLMAITSITDTAGNTIFQQDPGHQDGQANVLSAAEAYLITDVLKNYNTQWGLGWQRQMAGKSGTTGGSETGVHKDAWMMAYNPNIVVGAWGGNTDAGGGSQSISAFGTEVGQHMLGEFINGLPATYKDWYKQPDGIVSGHGCPGNKDAASEIFLAGTENDPRCGSAPSPSPSPSPSATPSSSPTATVPPVISPVPVRSPVPSLPPVISPAPSPKPT